ncbi:MAG: CcmD family protein [Chitinophagaceae bacterium]|nr:CcmD family protein [Chitinophagaceae bacterium]MBP6589612.1 CcmD family protein [Chitinophagaceae bacterium]MBP8244593.1 CcmD family protein [Chitinophagaceae bacterium]
MMKQLKRICLLAVLLLGNLPIFAQNKPTEMADLMRSNGRIYVVVAVMVTILGGLVFYVARLDRKISKFEKEK